MFTEFTDIDLRVSRSSNDHCFKFFFFSRAWLNKVREKYIKTSKLLPYERYKEYVKADRLLQLRKREERWKVRSIMRL